MRFGLRDLFGLVLLAALLAQPLVLFVGRMRAPARRAGCANNLRDVGTRFYVYAGRHPRNRFCSGASDYLRDGCPDTYGWVADHVNMSGYEAGALLDPSSPMPGSTTLNQLLLNDPRDADPETPPSRLAVGRCADSSGNPGSAGRAKWVSTHFVGPGYRTTYAADWTLVRGSVSTEVRDNTLYSSGSAANFKGLATWGPLNHRVLDRSRVCSANVPFLGCAAPAEPGGLLRRALAVADSKPVQHSESIPAGARLARRYGDGPSYWNSSRGAIERMRGGVTLEPEITCERDEPTTSECDAPTGTAPSGNNHYLQDTRHWYAAHAGQLNLLMGDGGVKTFTDRNGDGFLNPGFPVSSVRPEEAEHGFADATLELPPHEFFAGIFVWQFHYKSGIGSTGFDPVDR